MLSRLVDAAVLEADAEEEAGAVEGDEEGDGVVDEEVHEEVREEVHEESPAVEEAASRYRMAMVTERRSVRRRRFLVVFRVGYPLFSSAGL